MVNNRVLADFGVLLRLVYFSFCGPKLIKNRFYFGLVPRSFVFRFLTRSLDVSNFQIVVFGLKVLQKITSHGNRV